MAGRVKTLTQEGKYPDDNKPPIPTKDIPKGEKPTEKKLRQNKVIRVELSSDQKVDAVKLINDEMGKILTEYSEAGFYEKIEKFGNEYDLKKEDYVDFPVPDASNRKLALVTTMIDITASKGKRQTCGVDPMILLEQEDELEEGQSLHDREDHLDYTMRKKTHHEILAPLIYRDACIYGAAVVHCPYNHTEEFFVGENGEEARVTIHGADPYIVDLKNFFARLKIKDLNRHKVIAESRDFVWSDIAQRQESGFFDYEAVEELKRRTGVKYDSQDYKIYEAVVRAGLEDKGKVRRYLITFDDTHKIVLKSVYFPYEHMKAPYVISNAIPKKDSWLGYSYPERLEDVVSIANTFLNSTINEFTLAHMPVILTDDEDFDGDRMTLESMAVMKFAKGTQFQPLKFEFPSTDRIAFLSWSINFAEIISGVEMALLSGAETPHDPRAPAAKTAMKMRASTMRMEDVIGNMQVADAELAEQIESISFQYPLYEGEELEYWRDNKKKTVPLDFITKKVRYVCHGSTLSFDRMNDVRIAMELSTYTQKMHPEVWEDAEARYTLYKIIINNTQGSVQKYKDILLKPLEIKVKLKEQVKELLDTLGREKREPTVQELMFLARSGALGPAGQKILQEMMKGRTPGGAPSAPTPGGTPPAVPGGAPVSTPESIPLPGEPVKPGGI